MKYSMISGIDIPVSNIVFGCCNPILVNDFSGADGLLEEAFSRGFNFFDTAKVYGKSEEVLGRWMNSSGNRRRVVIISKGGHPEMYSRLNVQSIKEDLESSLDRLKTDYIDIYMLHRDDMSADIEAILTFLNDCLQKGLIRKIGVSNWAHKRIEVANSLAKKRGLIGFSLSSPQLSLARQIKDPWGGGCVSISWDGEAEQWYKEHPEVVVIAYSCLGRGLFSGKIESKHMIKLWKSLDYAGRKGYWSLENIKRLRVAENIAKETGRTVSQLSIAWCMNRGFKVYPIVSMSSKERMIENLGGDDFLISDNLRRRLGENI